MDFKTVLNGVLAMLLVFVLWMWAVRAFFPAPRSAQPAEEQAPAAASEQGPPPEAAEAATRPAIGEPRGPTTTPASQPAYTVAGSQQEQHIQLGSADDDPNRPFPMQIRFTTKGAAISEILLSDYDETLRKQGEDRVPYGLLRPLTDRQTGRVYDAMATERLVLFAGDQDKGTAVPLDGVDWKLVEQTDHVVAFQIAILEQGEPILRLTKRYELPEQPRKAGRHDVELSLSVENVGREPRSFTVHQLGPFGMKSEMLRSEDRHIYAAFKNGESVTLVLRKHSNIVKEEIPWQVEEDGKHLLWTAIDNQYFTCILAPQAEDLKGFGDLLARVEATHLTDNQGPDASADMTQRLVLARQTLQPNQRLSLGLECYFGPKSRSLFRNAQANPDYAERKYVYLIEKNYPWCTFAWLTNGMIVLLMFFGQKVFGNFGLGIIVLVLIVRTILHPLTKKGQVNMTKMQKRMATLQPKLEEAKKKYANDKAKLQEETMKVYREAGVNPAGQLLSCLPMVLQMPIWVALWASLSNTIEMRHAPFVLWIRDLTAPDQLVSCTPFMMPLISSMIGEIRGLNVLPILLSITMYFQQRFMPKAAKAEKRKDMKPDQLAQQQKMMSIMTVFFGVVLYNAPSGLNLYIMSSNVLGMIEQWRIRAHVREQEARAVSAPPPAAEEPKKTTWLGRLQKMAEEAKKHQPKAKRR